jgi:hypothetical protein
MDRNQCEFKSPFASLKRCQRLTATLHRSACVCTTGDFEVLTSPIAVSHFSDRTGAMPEPLVGRIVTFVPCGAVQTL